MENRKQNKIKGKGLNHKKVHKHVTYNTYNNNANLPDTLIRRSFYRYC